MDLRQKRHRPNASSETGGTAGEAAPPACGPVTWHPDAEFEAYRYVAEHATDLITRLDRQGRYLYASPSSRQVVGQDPAELLGRSAWESIHPDDLPGVKEAHEQAIAAPGQPVTLTYRRRRPDGRYIWLEATGQAVRDPVTGRVEAGISMARDVTERVQREQNLRQTERKLASVERRTHMGTWELDVATSKLTWSAELFRIFGTDPATFVPDLASFLDRVVPEDRERMRWAITRLLEVDEAYDHEYRIRRPDGQERTLRAQAEVVTDSRGPRTVFGSTQDITATRQEEARSRERAALVDLSHDAIYVRDFDTATLTFWSRGAEALYGWSSSEILGSPAYAVLNPIFPVPLSRITAQLEATGRWTGQLAQRTRDGRTVVVDSRWDLQRDPTGRPRAVLVSNTDVTGVRRLERQFSLLVESLPDRAIFVLDEAGRIQSWNEGTRRLLGHEADEVLGGLAPPLAPATDEGAPDVPGLLATARQTGTARVEGWVLRKGGDRFWAEVEVTRVRDDTGQPQGFGVVIRDLTARKRHEDELRASEAKFRNVFERATIGMAIGDLEGHLLDFNPALYRMLGYGPEDLRRLDIESLTDPQDRPRLRASLSRVASGDQGFDQMEKRCQRKDGSTFWSNVIFVLLPDASGKPEFLLGMVEDISDRKRSQELLQRAHDDLDTEVRERTAELIQTNEALRSEIGMREAVEQALRDRERMLNDAQELAHVGTWEWDLTRNQVVWTDELYRIYGLTPRQFGATFEAFLRQIHPDDRERIRTSVMHSYRTHEPFAFEERILRPDGQERVLSSHGRVELAPDGRPLRMMGTCYDVTDFKRVETEIRQLNSELEHRVADRTHQLEAANQELEAFSYSVSHDLRAPLRSIDGFSQALLEDYSDRLDDEGKDDLRRVRAATVRMGQLIDDMLMLSRLTRGELFRSRCDLSAMAREIVADLRRQAPGRRVEVHIADGLVAQADPRLMRAVLENLLGNAWKFTARHPEAHIEVTGETRAGERVFHVRDDGAGFDMAYVDKLFKPFSRLHAVTDFDGTGIGLATVQRVIHRHGGRAWAEGAVEKGATVSFTLPEGDL